MPTPVARFGVPRMGRSTPGSFDVSCGASMRRYTVFCAFCPALQLSLMLNLRSAVVLPRPLKPSLGTLPNCTRMLREPRSTEHEGVMMVMPSPSRLVVRTDRVSATL
ncbi:hypothetical protein D9M68_973470 [compost metagenome]